MQDKIQLPLIYLKPSQLFLRAGRENSPVKLVTVLGSCVSVVLFNSRLRMAAMCHALLPRVVNGKAGDGMEAPFRYIQYAVPEMILRFRRSGIGPEETDVCIFGGSDMFFSRTAGIRLPSVGQQNIETALDIIRQAGLNVKNADMGGTVGRKIFFYPHTGELWIKRLNQEKCKKMVVRWKKS